MNKDQLIIDELYHEDFKTHPGGHKPRRVKSSWGINERTPPPPRPTKYLFMLDEILPDKSTGNTIARAFSLEDAYACMTALKKENIRTVIRPVTIDEKFLQAETSHRKWLAQHGYQTPPNNNG